ncbi:bifunctional ADP-dependent (S)-NAD(P)H-hydrate dehydratase/NAD(P)H-hydrate epimerase [Spirochaetia bacterium]|nr:bifunctional ADP-dependent (S)-NAD(P)H-hydrate dehydratase/NAD(P)H-hydrate epimerase [Spirochaetia bacterium]
MTGTPLVSPEASAELDKEASASWGLNVFALVEAAGRACAGAFTKALEVLPQNHKLRILVCAGPGNNGADALVMLRALLTSGSPFCFSAAVLLSRYSAGETTAGNSTPGNLTAGTSTARSEALKALEAMGIPLVTWHDEEQAAELFREADIIIDGIAGTGIRGPLEGIPLAMVTALNRRRNTAQKSAGADCFVVSVDVPSGIFSIGPQEDAVYENTSALTVPIVRADYTLAIEPRKTILYTPLFRPYCGTIVPVTGIFPPPLLARYGEAELLSWKEVSALIPPLPPETYKYRRGLVEIHAGSAGSAGAARIAAAGAAAAGAGLVRLIADDDIYPVLAASAGAVMVVPASRAAGMPGRFKPDLMLLGPGWGREGRLPIVQKALEAEQNGIPASAKAGIPLILDADALALLRDSRPVFNGKTILTPHAGELENLSGIPRQKLLAAPALIASLAKEFNAVILFKSHVMIIADPGGRLGYIDGMDPSLGAGGSGDLLAGFCAGIGARIKAEERIFDPYIIAAAAGTLLVAASRKAGRRFYDPLELANFAAALAGEAWLTKKVCHE